MFAVRSLTGSKTTCVTTKGELSSQAAQQGRGARELARGRIYGRLRARKRLLLRRRLASAA